MLLFVCRRNSCDCYFPPGMRMLQFSNFNVHRSSVIGLFPWRQKIDCIVVSTDLANSDDFYLQVLPLGIILRLAYQSLGVVYGDVGTSPLYVFQTTFPDGVTDGRDILGALSLIIYTITIITLVKYMFIVLRANNDGEGATIMLNILHFLFFFRPSSRSTFIWPAISFYLRFAANCKLLHDRKQLPHDQKPMYEEIEVELSVWTLMGKLSCVCTLGSGVHTPEATDWLGICVLFVCCGHPAGGTFALYSLLCRHCNISALPNKHPTDEELTTFVVNCGSIKKTWLQKKLESSKVLQRILFIVVLCGTSMVIGDGILTPAISGNLFLLS